VNLITDSWRLKLLAIGLAVLMLGAVAFSQANTRTIQVNMTYKNLPTDLVLVAPPIQIGLSVSVPNDFVLVSSSVTASADLAHVKKGSAISVPVQVTSTDGRIVIQAPPPITVNVDTLVSKQLDIQVLTPNTAPGWTVTKAVAQCGNSPDPCQVTFTGPAALAASLSAYVNDPDQIAAGSAYSNGQPVLFRQRSRSIDLSKLSTTPQITWDPPTVTAYVEAKRGTSTTQVTLIDDAPTRRPPAPYRVTNITVEPLSVQCTGPADAIGRLTVINLPAVDLGGSTSNVSFNVRIPIPEGVSCSQPTVKVTYAISQNPNILPSPTPTPSP
jgi:YbbR domain-containing protein